MRLGCLESENGELKSQLEERVRFFESHFESSKMLVE